MLFIKLTSAFLLSLVTLKGILCHLYQHVGCDLCAAYGTSVDLQIPRAAHQRPLTCNLSASPAHAQMATGKKNRVFQRVVTYNAFFPIV